MIKKLLNIFIEGTSIIIKPVIDNSLKEFVLANYVQVNFKGKLLVKIPVKKSDGYVAYDGKVYRRQGNCSYYIKTVRARVYIFMESAFIGYYYRSIGEEFVYLMFGYLYLCFSSKKVLK